MGLASASAAPHHRAQAAAVDKIDLAELENDRSVKGQEVLDVSAASPPATMRPLQRTIATRPASRVSSVSRKNSP